MTNQSDLKSTLSKKHSESSSQKECFYIDLDDLDISVYAQKLFLLHLFGNLTE